MAAEDTVEIGWRTPSSRKPTGPRAVLDPRLPQLLAGRLATAIQSGHDYDYFQALAAQIATLDPDAVKTQITRVLDDAHSVTLIQGPPEGVDDAVKHNAIENPHVLPKMVHDEDD